MAGDADRNIRLPKNTWDPKFLKFQYRGKARRCSPVEPDPEYAHAHASYAYATVEAHEPLDWSWKDGRLAVIVDNTIANNKPCDHAWCFKIAVVQ
ncbi:MAG: hypothetical protein JW839_22900 [Candidatus Lokiarchaeota archaeon]|nr:hypothetical protein [Candidatus Lokiarchaeota archaeon]